MTVASHGQDGDGQTPGKPGSGLCNPGKPGSGVCNPGKPGSGGLP